MLMTALTVSAAFAQGMGMTGWSSPQSQATQGRMRSDADNFIRPDAYTGVNFDTWYGMMSFGAGSSSGFTAGNGVHAGFATRFGGGEDSNGIYVAGYYGGNFWQNKPMYTTHEYFEADAEINSKITVINPYDSFENCPFNRFGVLVGVADMGFRFSLLTNRLSFSEDGFYTEDEFDALEFRYKNYEEKVGSITPQIAWSMARDLTPNGIKPYVTFDLRFHNNYQRYTAYEDGVGGGIGAGDLESETIARSANYIQPIIQAGLGSYNLWEKGAFRLSGDLEYRVRWTSFNNDYNYMESGESKVTSGKVRNNGTALYETSASLNEIMPAIAGQWRGDNLGLRFRLNLPVNIFSGENTTQGFKEYNVSSSLQNQGPSTSVSSILFSPNLQLGAQWTVHPKFTINAGGLINMSTLARTKVETETYNSGEVVENSKETTIVKTYGNNGNLPSAVTDISGFTGLSRNNTQNQLTLGVTLRATDNMTIEANSGIVATNQINVFQWDGVFAFSSILVGLKF